MRQLGRGGYERARSFIREQGREVDAAVLAHVLDGAPRTAVADALGPYQNADGGFGHGIEPDFLLPSSSPMATSHALEMWMACGPTAAERPLRRAVEYLLGNFDPARPGWEDVPREVSDHPHAPWWRRDGSLRFGPENVWGNPDAEIIGILFAYRSLVPPPLLDELGVLAVDRLDLIDAAPPGYVTRAYARFALHAPADLAHPVLERLRTDVRETLRLDSGAWRDGEMRPYWIAPSPAAPLATTLEPELSESLDLEVERQAEDGSWPPRWSWESFFPEVWPEASVRIASDQTALVLRSLAAHGRIEGLPRA